MSPEERGPVEGSLRRKAETDRVREGISEGCRSAEPNWSLMEVRERLSPSPAQLRHVSNEHLSAHPFRVVRRGVIERKDVGG